MYRYRRSITFSSTELKHLTISVLILTLSFTFASIYGRWQFQNLATIQKTLLISFIAVLTAFLFHELAHKYTANRYGYWAEYRASYFFLILALACSLLLGFVFAAPGAVVIAGYLSRRENGIISIAGPLTNFAIALLFTPLIFLPLSQILIEIAESIVFVNLFIAGFNLIPFANLDGAKVFAWNWKIWLLSILAIVLAFIFIFYPGLF